MTQFHAVACREYTLPREERASQPRGWILGNTKIGPVLEVTTNYLHGKHGVEIRIWSLNGDNTHSWVRISHGSNKFVMDSNNNDTEVPENQLEEQALHLNAEEFVSQPKTKAKPQRRKPAESSSGTIPAMSCTILAQCMEKTSRRGLLGRHRSCDSDGIDTRSNAIILQETLPAYCIPKVVRLKTGEV